jgi:ketosteroid isomerase-like protein
VASNAEKAVAGFRAWQRGDLEAAFTNTGPEFVFDNRTGAPGAEGVWHGPEGLKAMMDKVLEAFSEYSLELVESRERGDQVELILREVGRGRHSGIVIERRLKNAYTFEDGRVVKIESTVVEND